MMIDDDLFHGFFEDFRGCDELGDVRVGDDDDGLIRHESLCLALIDEEPSAAPLFSIASTILRQVSRSFERRHAPRHGSAREVGDADCRSQGIKVFMIMPHDEHHICVFDDLLQRLCDDADAHTGGGDGRRDFPPKAFTSFPRRTIA